MKKEIDDELEIDEELEKELSTCMNRMESILSDQMIIQYFTGMTVSYCYERLTKKYLHKLIDQRWKEEEARNETEE